MDSYISKYQFKSIGNNLLKGIIVNAYGIYSEDIADEMLEKLK